MTFPGKSVFVALGAFVAGSAWTCFAYADLPSPKPVQAEACVETLDASAHGLASMAFPRHREDSTYHWIESTSHREQSTTHYWASKDHHVGSTTHHELSSWHYDQSKWYEPWPIYP